MVSDKLFDKNNTQSIIIPLYARENKKNLVFLNEITTLLRNCHPGINLTRFSCKDRETVKASEYACSGYYRKRYDKKRFRLCCQESFLGLPCMGMCAV